MHSRNASGHLKNQRKQPIQQVRSRSRSHSKEHRIATNPSFYSASSSNAVGAFSLRSKKQSVSKSTRFKRTNSASPKENISVTTNSVNIKLVKSNTSKNTTNRTQAYVQNVSIDHSVTSNTKSAGRNYPKQEPVNFFSNKDLVTQSQEALTKAAEVQIENQNQTNLIEKQRTEMKDLKDKLASLKRKLCAKNEEAKMLKSEQIKTELLFEKQE